MIIKINNLKELEKLSIDIKIKLNELAFYDNFNYPLSDSLNKLVNLRNLTFGDSFNQLPIKFFKFYGAPEN